MGHDETADELASNDRMDFRLPHEHKALIEKAAAYSGESLTGFAVATLVEHARQVVRDHEKTRLSARDRDRFLELLDQAPAPTGALRRAADRHRALVERDER